MSKGAIRLTEGAVVTSPMGEGLIVGFTQVKNQDAEGNALRGRPTTIALVGGLKTAKGKERAKPVPFRLGELKF